jgi:uncharacterized protein (TIGR04255 family)
MEFPESEHAIYENNPLEEVICQVRFPPILRIDAEVPADFQDDIRHSYPLFREERGVELGPRVPPEIAAALARESGPAQAKYSFLSDDEREAIALTRGFLALTCRAYECWAVFREHLETALQALRNRYDPPFFTRVGLRYKNVICRSKLQLRDASWHELLKPPIAGELATGEIAAHVLSAARQIEIALDREGTQVRVRHGLVKGPNGDEECFTIDSDFFTDNKTEIDNVFPILDYFNEQAARLFRWCIDDRLHTAMRPSVPHPTC